MGAAAGVNITAGDPALTFPSELQFQCPLLLPIQFTGHNARKSHFLTETGPRDITF